jgi:hypothetical protein
MRILDWLKSVIIRIYKIFSGWGVLGLSGEIGQANDPFSHQNKKELGRRRKKEERNK